MPDAQTKKAWHYRPGSYENQLSLGNSGISNAECRRRTGTYLADDNNAKHDDQSQHDSVLDSCGAFFIGEKPLDGVQHGADSQLWFNEGDREMIK